MTQNLLTISNDDVEIIDRLVSTLNSSDFEYMELKTGSFQVLIGKSVPAQAAPAAPASAPVQAGAGAPQVLAEPSAAPLPEAVAAPAAAAPTDNNKDAAAHAGLLQITAPSIGRFYSKPDPNSEPFVKVGDVVNKETAIGLVEVMKLFNSIEAGVAGEIVEVCVADGELIEHGSVLMLVKPV